MPSYAALCVFVLVVLFVIALATYPIHIKIPRTTYAPAVGYWVPPVVGVVVLLASGVIDAGEVNRGIVGSPDMRPFGIAIIFMTLAFMCAALDATGLFAWLALKLTRLSHGRGRLLFMSYYLLSSVVTCFTSNDIVVMTLTPIICYFASAAKADPMPFLVAEFTAANLWSMLLFIGNPTNIIAAQAAHMSFFAYSKWMALPTLASGATSLVLLHLLHGRHVPPALHLPDLDPAAALMDPVGAAVGSTLVVACLGLLAAGPSTGWPLWGVTLACALLHCAYCLAAYVLLPLCRPHSPAAQADDTPFSGPDALCAAKALAGGCQAVPQDDAGTNDLATESQRPTEHTAIAIHTACAGGSLPTTAALAAQQPPAAALAPGGDVAGDGPPSEPPTPLRRVQQGARPSFAALLLKLPWHVVPFVLGMFVLVEALAVTGWVDRLARVLGRACSGGTPATLAVMGGVAVAAANAINNQPMTILLTRAVLSGEFLREAGGSTALQRTALFAVVVGSNLGALFGPVGALAGIMWSAVLARRGVPVGAARFVRLMAPLGLACTVAALVVLGLEMLVF